MQALLKNAGISVEATDKANKIQEEKHFPIMRPLNNRRSDDNIAVSWRERWEAEVQRMEDRRAANKDKNTTQHVSVRFARRKEKAPFRNGRIIGYAKRGTQASKRVAPGYGDSQIESRRGQNQKKEEIELLIRNIRMRNYEEGGAFVF